jgi:hypothetical protein
VAVNPVLSLAWLLVQPLKLSGGAGRGGGPGQRRPPDPSQDGSSGERQMYLD